MNRLDQLRHVAGLVGIATRHVDALGVVHEPGEETLARLIAACGLPAEPHRAADALAEIEREALFGLPPLAVVAHEDGAPVLALRLPDGVPAVEWHLRCEDGAQLEGRSHGPELRLPPGLPLGYHRLSVAAGGTASDISLAFAPAACHLGQALEQGGSCWGLTAQLYGLRGARDRGIGDFSALAELCRGAGRLGAAAVGINPLHALFAAEPRHCSPYSPSSRLWLDYLYLDVTRVPGFAGDATPPPNACEPLVDYAAVAALKRPVLEAAFRRFRSEDGPFAAEFRAFREADGAALADFATFEALHEQFLAAGIGFAWHGWPAALRDPRSPAVAEFARAHAERVEFFAFLQWQADRQLAEAAAAGREGGLAIGLYRDLAVGVNPNGAEAWADRELVVPDASIGAPPDALSRRGQDWGLAPVNPVALRRRGFAPFIAALRANMRHAGILRIDHVMGLQRLYWVPSGCSATAGAYVNYPFRDLLRLLALESRRHGCAVIGEDLGTVPDGFRETMQRAGVLSYRIFGFERRGDGGFVPPRDYPPLAAAAAATHDLPTLKGFWLGSDIAWRQRLGLYPDAAAAAGEIDGRRRDRHLLLQALAGQGLLEPGRFGEFLTTDETPLWNAELGEAIHAYLGRSRARLVLVQLEDVAGECEQANLPGTTDGHPNWRRRLSVPLDQLLAGPATARLAALLAAERRRSAAS